jgi:hypothetical protein
MDKFEYDAPAEVYWGDGDASRKRPMMCRGFVHSAEAICFAIEQLPQSIQPRTILEVGGDRIKFTRIRALYDSERYPLIRGVRQNINSLSRPGDQATIARLASVRAAPPHGRTSNGR